MAARFLKFTHHVALLLLCQTLTMTTALANPAPAPTTVAAASNLTAYDQAIIGDYASRGYFINNVLDDVVDTGVEGLVGPVFRLSPFAQTDLERTRDYRYILHLNRALDHLPPYQGNVYRGIYTTDRKKTEARFAEGRVWNERRFTSTTTDKKVAMDFARGAYKNEGCGGCDASIQNPQSRNMVFITIESLAGRDIQRFASETEKEVLFKSGTVFKVMKAKRDERGRFFAELKELDPLQLSAADRTALLKSENERFQRILLEVYGAATTPPTLEAGLKEFRKSFEASNELHTKLRTEGAILDTPIDFEAESAEGG